MVTDKEYKSEWRKGIAALCICVIVLIAFTWFVFSNDSVDGKLEFKYYTLTGHLDYWTPNWGEPGGYILFVSNGVYSDGDFVENATHDEHWFSKLNYSVDVMDGFVGKNVTIYYHTNLDENNYITAIDTILWEA